MSLSSIDAEGILATNFAPWVLELGLKVESMGKVEATLRLPFSDRLVRVGGTICGQALMTAADTAMVLAVSAGSGGFRPMTTVNQTISFMKPVSSADALITGRVLRLGRTLAFGEIEIRAEGRDDLVAHATTTYAILGPAAGNN